MSKGDIKISSVSMGQAVATLADIAAAYIGSMQPQGYSGTEGELKVFHQLAISLFLHQLLMRSQHKEEMAGILEAIIVELRNPVKAA